MKDALCADCIEQAIPIDTAFQVLSQQIISDINNASLTAVIDLQTLRGTWGALRFGVWRLVVRHTEIPSYRQINRALGCDV